MIWRRPEAKLIQIRKGLEWAGRKQKGVNWELQGQEGEVMMGEEPQPCPGRFGEQQQPCLKRSLEEP